VKAGLVGPGCCPHDAQRDRRLRLPREADLGLAGDLVSPVVPPRSITPRDGSDRQPFSVAPWRAYGGRP